MSAAQTAAPSLSSHTQPTVTAVALSPHVAAAKAEIGAAWQSHKKSTLEFGRICYDWAARLDKSEGGYGGGGHVR